MQYLSILATFKNEAMILEEWIEHHKWQGFDHIYLINNDSDDNYMEVLKEYIKNGFVTLFNLPGKYQQINNYNIVYRQIRHNTQWLSICDIDEYWFTPVSTVRDYISNLDKQNIHSLYTRWYAFGSSGFIEQPPSIREHFVNRSADVGSVKSIIKTSNAIRLHIHQHDLINETAIKIDYENIRLNHYRVMSREYFTTTKLVRGSPSGYPSLDICDTYRNEEYFKVNDTNDVEDTLLKDILLQNKNIPENQTTPVVSSNSAIDRLRALSSKKYTH